MTYSDWLWKGIFFWLIIICNLSLGVNGHHNDTCQPVGGGPAFCVSPRYCREGFKEHLLPCTDGKVCCPLPTSPSPSVKPTVSAVNAGRDTRPAGDTCQPLSGRPTTCASKRYCSEGSRNDLSPCTGGKVCCPIPTSPSTSTPPKADRDRRPSDYDRRPSDYDRNPPREDPRDRPSRRPYDEPTRGYPPRDRVRRPTYDPPPRRRPERPRYPYDDDYDDRRRPAYDEDDYIPPPRRRRPTRPVDDYDYEDDPPPRPTRTRRPPPRDDYDYVPRPRPNPNRRRPPSRPVDDYPPERPRRPIDYDEPPRRRPNRPRRPVDVDDEGYRIRERDRTRGSRPAGTPGKIKFDEDDDYYYEERDPEASVDPRNPRPQGSSADSSDDDYYEDDTTSNYPNRDSAEAPPSDESTTLVPTVAKVPGCGVKPYELFIAGGETSKPHEWPWMIAIFRRQNNRPKTFICGGALINTKYVLTAAHCFVNNYKTLPASNFVVKLGAHQLSSGEEFTISELVVHHNHSGNDFFNDIALLKLAGKVFVTDKVAPICLPPANMRASDLVGQEATVAGWGDTSFRTTAARVLQHVSIPIVSGEDCFSAYSRVRGAAFLARGSDHVICAGLREGGKDACLGDSGGPLMLKSSEDLWMIIGVVSLGYKCAEPGYPGVYTRVTHYLPWIHQNMKDV